MATTPDSTTASSGLRLRRTLTLWDLVLYGIIVIQPTAPMPGYGVFANAGQGHVVTCILIAMVAMVFTAISYGRMARVYPSAGSAYTYVGREIHPALGFVTGWSMTMDYMLNPLICTIWCGKAMADFFPGVLAALAGSSPLRCCSRVLNLRGVETSARINQVLCAAMGVVIVVFFGVTIRYLFPSGRIPRQFFLQPFYNPQTFTPNASCSRNLARGAHLHRLRRHLHALGRSAQSQAQHPAGDRAGVRDHRHSRVGRSVWRATAAAGYVLLRSRSRDGLQLTWPPSPGGHLLQPSASRC